MLLSNGVRIEVIPSGQCRRKSMRRKNQARLGNGRIHKVLVRPAQSFYHRQRIVEELVLELMKKSGFWEHLLQSLASLKTVLPPLAWRERPTLVRELDCCDGGGKYEAMGMARCETVAGVPAMNHSSEFRKQRSK